MELNQIQKENLLANLYEKYYMLKNMKHMDLRRRNLSSSGLWHYVCGRMPVSDIALRKRK